MESATSKLISTAIFHELELNARRPPVQAQSAGLNNRDPFHSHEYNALDTSWKHGLVSASLADIKVERRGSIMTDLLSTFRPGSCL